MAEIGETRSFPLLTILSIMHANKLGRRGVERTTIVVNDAIELQKHMFPGVERKPWQEEGYYLRNQFAPLLRKQFPQLAHISLSKVTQSNFEEWMEVQESEFGKHIDVPVIGKGPRT